MFPYGYEDPWIGVPIAPWAGDPNGNNLNFAYGGAQIRQGDEVVPDLDGQTDTFKNAVDGDADPNALYLITIGGNDVRSLAPSGGAPESDAEAFAALDAAAAQYFTELSQLFAMGARHFVITGVPDVGLIPDYDLQNPGQPGYNVLDGAEIERSAAATEFSIYLDAAIRNIVVSALEDMGATVTYVPLMDYVDANGILVTGALSANLPTIAALHGLTTEELTGNLLEYRELLFFDDIHPNGQANALLGAYMHAQLNGTDWIEILPLSGPKMNFTVNGVISVVGEVDKTVVSLVAGTTYTVELLGMSSLGLFGTLGDGSLSILNSSGTALTLFTTTSGNDSGAGFDATFTFTAATSGNYTFELSGAGSLTGAYTLQAGVVSGAAMTQANTYVVNSAATGVIEGVGGFGNDAVNASVSYALSAGSEIEILQTTNAKGKTALNLTGNEFGQAIIGNAGANVLEGKGGADVFTGGAGKDVFVLSNTAVTHPGAANIDRITDYASGDVVDVSQVLKVAAGTNVVGGGYLRVTTSGLVQVDLDGGGNDWVTLSTINGNGSVAVRYVSGGAVTNVTVARVSETQLRSSSSNTTLVSAVAASGVVAVPETTTSLLAADDGFVMAHSSPMMGDLTGAKPDLGDGLARSALSGETREALETGAVPQLVNFAFEAAYANGSQALVSGETAAGPGLTQLLPGTETQGHTDAIGMAVVAQALAMPSADMLRALHDGPQVADVATSNAEVGRVLADALSGGKAATIDTLLDALAGPDVASQALFAVRSWDPGAVEFAAVAGLAIATEALVLHQDSVPTA